MNITITILGFAFVGWLLLRCWKITLIATENAVKEAEQGNIEPLRELMDAEGGLK